MLTNQAEATFRQVHSASRALKTEDQGLPTRAAGMAFPQEQSISRRNIQPGCHEKCQVLTTGLEQVLRTSQHRSALRRKAIHSRNAHCGSQLPAAHTLGGHGSTPLPLADSPQGPLPGDGLHLAASGPSGSLNCLGTHSGENPTFKSIPFSWYLRFTSRDHSGDSSCQSH